MISTELTTREKISISLFFVSITVGIGAMYVFPRIAIPLGISYILNLILTPLNQALIKIGLNRTLAAITILVGILFFSIYPIVKIVPLLSSETDNIQYYIPKVENYIQNEYFKMKEFTEDKFGFELQDHYISDGLTYVRQAISSFLLNLPNLIAPVVEWVFVIPLFLFFMLKDAPHFKRKFLQMTPNRLFEKFYFLSHKFNKQLGDYILAKFIEASIVGLLITSGLLFIDVRFAVLFGLIAALTNVIPYLGPVIGSVPGIIFALVEYGTGATFGAVALLYIISNAIDIAIVFPILVSKIVDLHPVIVVASVILGSQLFGVVGMVISIPVAAAFKLIFQEVFEDNYT